MRPPWETLDDKVRKKTHELALARIVELEAALAFYADPDMHMPRGLDGQFKSFASADGGDLARRTLGDQWEDINPAHVELDL